MSNEIKIIALKLSIFWGHNHFRLTRRKRESQGAIHQVNAFKKQKCVILIMEVKFIAGHNSI